MAEPPVPIEERAFPHLTEMQEAFVLNYLANGGDGQAAAIAAGYAENSAAVQASQMLRKPPIAQAILECLATSMAASAVKAWKRIDHLIDTSKSDYVRLEASKDILNRVGAIAPKRVALSGGVSISIDLGEGD